MQTNIQDVNSYTKKIEVDIEADELTPIEQKVIKNYQKSSKIPGFRPGKAPINIVRQRHQQLIRQDLLEEALRFFYIRALQESELQPVADGKITDLRFEEPKNGLSFVIEVEVEPEVELKNYKGLKVEKEVVNVDADMVDDVLGRIQEQYATVQEVEQAKEGDYVYFDAQELDKGDIPVIGKKYENLQLVLGEGNFDPEIENQLEGIKKGEKRIVRKDISDSSKGQEGEQQTSSLEIHAKKIEQKDFPELNDDFVKNLEDESLENLNQLKDRVHKNLEVDLENRGENQLRGRLIDELIKENPFEVPPSMIENYLNEMVKNIENQSPNREIDEESVRKEYRASAIHNIRWHFLKRKLIEQEKISVTDEEILKLIDESQIDNKMKEQAKKDQHYLDHLKEDLLERKVIELLKKHAEVVEVYPPKKNKAS